MEQSLPTEDESKNNGEAGRGNDQRVLPTDAMEIQEGPPFEIQEQTSPGSDWHLNIPLELLSSLDDRGHPIVNAIQNPWEDTFPKVPLRLRKNPRSEDYFDPTVISFGPYHHGKGELQETDTIKTEAMLKFIKESGKSFMEFYRKVHEMNDDTRAHYIDCSEEKYDNEKFALIMLRDGCFISYLLDKFVQEKDEDVLLLFVNHGNYLGLNSAVRDMVLLENQIPLAVLKLLMSLKYNNNNEVAPKMIKQYIYYALWGISPREVPEDEDKGPQAEEPRHLLECIKKELSKVVDRKKERTHCFNFVPASKKEQDPADDHKKESADDDKEKQNLADDDKEKQNLADDDKEKPNLADDDIEKQNLADDDKEKQNLADDDIEKQNLADHYPSYRSLSELKAKGIHFKPINSSPHSLKERKSFSFNDVEFIPGFFYAQLKLPPLILNYQTIILWNNLVAFELSLPIGVGLVITSYISFLNALIANPDDVKELRSKRILLNDVGSDEEMFKFFKEIYTGSIQDISVYKKVRQDIEKHCSSKMRTLVAEIIYKYFRNPWSAIGLFAAIAVVALTFLQTYFTIYPGKD